MVSYVSRIAWALFLTHAAFGACALTGSLAAHDDAKPADKPQPASKVDDLALPGVPPRGEPVVPVTAVVFEPRGTRLAIARDREVLLVDPASRRIVRAFTEPTGTVNTLAFSTDGTLLAAGEGLPGVTGRIHLWKLADGAHRELVGHTDSVYGLVFGRDGSQLFSCGYDKLVLQWDLSQGRIAQTLKRHTAAVFAVDLHTNGNVLATASADATVKVFDIARGSNFATATEPTKGLSCVVFRPQSDQIVAAGGDKQLRVWDLTGINPKLRTSQFAHDAPITCLAVDAEGKQLFSGSEDKHVKAWSFENGLGPVHDYGELADWPVGLSVSPRGDRLAVALHNGTVVLLETTGRRSREVLGPVWSKVADTNRRRAGAVMPPVTTSASRGRTSALTAVPGDPRVENLAIPATWRAPRYRGHDCPRSPLVGAALRCQKARPKRPAPPGTTTPAAPQLDAIAPVLVPRGQTTKVRLTGKNIWDADGVVVVPIDVEARLLPGDEKSPNQIDCELIVPATLRPQQVSLRLHTLDGNTAAKQVLVIPFAEMAEKEPNDLTDQTHDVTLPTTLSGKIAARGDRDGFRFEAKAGEELVFVATIPPGAGVWSPRLQLRDETGRLLAEAARTPSTGETALGFRFAAAGRYRLDIEDRYQTGAANLSYSVWAGSFPYITRRYPLGVKAGSDGTTVRLEGHNLAGAKVTIPSEPGRSLLVAETERGRSLNAVAVEVSTLPELSETVDGDVGSLPATAMPLPVPGAVSGRIVLRGGEKAEPSATGAPRSEFDSDCYAFAAKKGETLALEVFARRLGSPLDPFIEVLDSQARPVGRLQLRPVNETYTVLRDHDSKVRGIRLQAWDDVRPNDFILIGQEVVKVEILPLGPDEDVKFFEKGGLRRAFLGSTSQAHALNAPAFKVETHPFEARLAPNGMPVVPVYFQNDDGGPDFQGDSFLLFDPPADGTYFVRVRDVGGRGSEESQYRLVVRPRRPDFRVSLNPENPSVPRGGSVPVTVNLDRFDDFADAVRIEVEGLPPDLTATGCVIGPDAHVGTVLFSARDDIPDLTFAEGRTLTVRGRALIGGVEEVRSSQPTLLFHQPALAAAPDITVKLEPEEVAIVPGQQATFRVTVDRRTGFSGRIPVEVFNLPLGLRVLDVGLNGVLITDGETSRTFTLVCDPWAPAGETTFSVAGRIESRNQKYAAPSVRVRVRK